MEYGDKRDYKKIDIFINNKYECSTTWAKTCKEAITKYIDKNAISLFMARARNIKANFSK